MPFARFLFFARLAPLLVAGLGIATAQEPAAALREMSTDRPDATESPFTINPGHVQLEMDVVAFARDRESGVRTEEWEAAPFNLRFGVTRNFEAGIFLSPYRRVAETPRAGPRETHSGAGDTVLRTKWNFAGNDGGDFGWGLMADIKLPTATRALGNGKLEGALTLPIAFELGAGWGGGAMTAVEAVYTDAGRFRAAWSNTLTVGRDLAENTGAFVELTSIAGDGPHVATFNAGLTHRLSADLQLDCGVNVGISRRAPDLLIFAGLARRF